MQRLLQQVAWSRPVARQLWAVRRPPWNGAQSGVSVRLLCSRKLPEGEDGSNPVGSARENAQLTEQFVRGFGKGGQKVNKTSNAVVLKDEVSGIVVKCHETRSLQQNRKIARKLMDQKLEELDLGKDSAVQKKIAKLRKKKAKKKARARQKYAPDVSHLLDEAPTESSDEAPMHGHDEGGGKDENTVQ
mmetsp:Transcript_17138/g.66737  ORF Transcript_17138/g.66737 Transcript_17138/m.66737 type:complete len:188 (+) Transcript_17138:46-609(+)